MRSGGATRLWNRAHLAGAGLDVYPDEPHVDPRLIAHPNVMTLEAPTIGKRAHRRGAEAFGPQKCDSPTSPACGPMGTARPISGA